jgi:hypothetical protein
MAEGMALASLRAETAQLLAEKDADIARLKYDLAVERGEREKLATLGEQLGRANAALEGELESSVELLRLERAKTARLSAALDKARAFRDRVDTMRHEMQRGVMIAFNQLSRATTALDGEMHAFFGAMHNKDEWDFDFDVDVDATCDDENGGAGFGRNAAPSSHTTPAKARDMSSFFDSLATPKATRASPGAKSDDKLLRVASEY